MRVPASIFSSLYHYWVSVPTHRDRFHWVGIWDTAAPIQSLTNDPYIGGLRAFGGLRDFECNLIPFSQDKSFTLNSTTMNEYILFVFHLNKSNPLLIAKPFGSTFHYTLPWKSYCKLSYSSGPYKQPQSVEYGLGYPLSFFCKNDEKDNQEKDCWRDPSRKIVSFQNLLSVSGFILKSLLKRI